MTSLVSSQLVSVVENMKEVIIEVMKRKRPYSCGAFESSSKDTTLMKKVEVIQWISPLKAFPHYKKNDLS